MPMARLRHVGIFHMVAATAGRSRHSSKETAMEKAYLEDLAPGQVFTSQARVVVETDAIKRFAGEFDPQPWHLNETVARSTFFKELVASGWHTTALTMQLIIQTLPLSEGIIGRGVDELRWPRPVRPGDTLRLHCEIIDVQESKVRPAQGTVQVRMTTLNQDDQPVQTMVAHLLAFRRSGETTYGAVSGGGAASAPEPAAREGGAFDQRAQLGPRHVGMDLIARARGAEAAVGAGDHSLASDHPGEALDALRHQLRMLDEMHAVRDHAGDQELVVRQLDLPPDRPFVLVTRVRRFDDAGAGPHLEHEIDELAELEVVHARGDVDAVAGVEADAVLRDAAKRMIERLDAQRDELAAVVDRGIDLTIVMRRHPRIVDLQDEPGIGDRDVLDAHRL